MRRRGKERKRKDGSGEESRGKARRTEEWKRKKGVRRTWREEKIEEKEKEERKGDEKGEVDCDLTAQTSVMSELARSGV